MSGGWSPVNAWLYAASGDPVYANLGPYTDTAGVARRYGRASAVYVSGRGESKLGASPVPISERHFLHMRYWE